MTTCCVVGQAEPLDPLVHASPSLSSSELMETVNRGLAAVLLLLTTLSPRDCRTVQAVQAAFDELMNVRNGCGGDRVAAGGGSLRCRTP